MSKNNGTGNIMTFGTLDLEYSLYLDEEDIKKNSIKFDEIKDLNDLLFLTNNKLLWSRFIVSSTTESLKLLLQMNKTSTNKNIITLIVYSKTEFNQQQEKFRDLIENVLLNNGITLRPLNMFKSKINILFKLIYKSTKKVITFYNKEGGGEGGKKEEKEDKDDIGIFDNINEGDIYYQDYKYIFFNICDYCDGGEFSNVINFKQLINYIRKIKEKNTIKVITNFGDNYKNEENFINLLKLSDIHMFRDINNIFNLFEKSKEEKKERNLRIRRKLFYDTKCCSYSTKFSPTKIDEQSTFFNNEKIKINKNKKLNNWQSTDNLKSGNNYSKYQNKFTEKIKLYEYLYEKIFINNNNKTNIIINNPKEVIGIYLEDFKKVYNFYYLMNNKNNPLIKEYNFDFFPKANVRNISEVEKTRNIIKKNKQKYNIILEGNLIGTFINYYKLIDFDKCFFLSYSASNIILKKNILTETYNLNIPENSSFFDIDLNNSEIIHSLENEMTKIKENSFNLNFYSKSENKGINLYNPLLDKYSISFLQSSVHLGTLREKKLITDKRKVLYDPVYREVFGKEPDKDNKLIMNKDFFKFIKCQDCIKNPKIKHTVYLKEFKGKRAELDYILPGYNDIPEYIVYLKNSLKMSKGNLPPIHDNKTRCDLTKKFIIGGKIQTKEPDGPGRVFSSNENLNDLKEAKFNPTPVDKMDS